MKDPNKIKLKTLTFAKEIISNSLERLKGYIDK